MVISSHPLITPEVSAHIEQILKRGNSAEIKREKDKIVVVEIQRQVKIKAELAQK